MNVKICVYWWPLDNTHALKISILKQLILLVFGNYCTRCLRLAMKMTGSVFFGLV